MDVVEQQVELVVLWDVSLGLAYLVEVPRREVVETEGEEVAE